jgi:hypothetical protein
MRDAFIYLAHKPRNTSKRIVRVHNSLTAHAPHLDFHVVTFDTASREGTYQAKFNGISVPHTIYNTYSLSELSYPNRVTTGKFSLTARGYVDLPVILFWINNSHYGKFWVMEDDVEYTGDFGTLINEIDETNKNAGLACTHLRKLPADWDYTYMFSTGQDFVSADMQRRVCFLPFFCVTGEALSIIHSAYMRGWAGYNEMTWATILDFAGVPIRDIGGNGPYVAPEDRNRRYIDESKDDFQKLGSFGTLNIRLFGGRKKNVLWHPVKTPKNFIRFKLKRAISSYRWYKAQLSSRIKYPVQISD